MVHMVNLLEEQKLIEKSKNDLKAFGALYDLYVKKIYSFVAYLVGNNTEAEDIVSETFEKAMLNLEKFEYRGYSFGAWLYKIARNLVYDRSKSKRHVSLDEVENFLGDSDLNPETLVEKSEKSTILNNLISKLKKEQREVIYLRYIQKYSIKEVCKILDKSEDSVKSLAKRGIQRLQDLTL